VPITPQANGNALQRPKVSLFRSSPENHLTRCQIDVGMVPACSFRIHSRCLLDNPARQRCSISQSDGCALGLDFVPVVTQSMCKFVPDRKIQQVSDRHVPDVAKFRAASRCSNYQSAVKKCFSFRQIAECRIVCIKSPLRQHLLPVHSSNQNPSPFAECIHVIWSLSFSQYGNSGVALLPRIPCVAGKMLLAGWLVGPRGTACLSGKRARRQQKGDHHHYACQQNQARSAVNTTWEADGVRFVISEVSFHVVLFRGVPRWRQRPPRVLLPQWLETCLVIKRMLKEHQPLSS